MANSRGSQRRLLVFAPTRRAASETFVRANLAGLPFAVQAYFGDECPWRQPDRCAYGMSVWLSKVFTRLGWLRVAGWPAARVAEVLIRRHQPDLMMAEFGFHAVRVMDAAKATGVPLVVHFRGSDLSAQSKVGVLKSRYRHLLRFADGVICKSEPMAQTLRQLGANPSRLLISASGANTALFYGSNPSQAAPVFLAVGRFVPKKGPLHTIRAFQQQPLGQLWMVGEGPLLLQAEALVQDLGLQDRVRFFGALPQVKVAALMREARVFVQHSLVAADGDSEGNPVSVMEAQLSGLPVVATRHGGIPEVVLDQQTGCLVEEGDVSGMAAAMQHLMADPLLAERYGAAGRRQILAGFTLEHHLQDVTKFLEMVMDSHRLRLRA